MFKETVKAATAERGSAWQFIKTAINECDRLGVQPTAMDTLKGLHADLEAAGVELQVKTVQERLVTGRYWADSTPTQQKAFESHGWTTIRTFAKAGWTQEAAAELIAATGGYISKRDAERAVSPDRSSSRSPGTPEDAISDQKVMAACALVARAVAAIDHGTYKPAPIVAAALEVIVQRQQHDWDAALAELTHDHR